MKIKVTKNGPYLINGDIPLYKSDIIIDFEEYPVKYGNNEKIDTGETYALCRCGHSKNKPFCDNTHLSIDFNGEEVASKNIYKESVRIFETEKFKLFDAPQICDHARFCTRAGGIHELIKKEDEKSGKIAMEEAELCPSGRLTLIEKENHESSEPYYEKEINVLYDTGKKKLAGIWVKGGIPIESVEGYEYEVRNRMSLCRCGKSDNKPFCDGSHWASPEFQANFKKKWDIK